MYKDPILTGRIYDAVRSLYSAAAYRVTLRCSVSAAAVMHSDRLNDGQEWDTALPKERCIRLRCILAATGGND